MRLGRRVSLLVAFYLLISVGTAPLQASAAETWVSNVTSGREWAVFRCSNWLVTVACGTDKDYSDAGTLPASIAVGDTVAYTNKDGKPETFIVRRINYFVFDKDIDTKWGGQRIVTRKGDTSCFLYDTGSGSTDYVSKVVIKGCRAVGR
jgi:plastocyanin